MLSQSGPGRALSGDDGDATGEGLQDDIPEAFAETGEHQQRRRSKEIPFVTSIDRAPESYAFGRDPECFRKVLPFGPNSLRIRTDQVQSPSRKSRMQVGPGSDEEVASLDGVES